MWQVFNLASERVVALDNQDIAVLLGGSRNRYWGSRYASPRGRQPPHATQPESTQLLWPSKGAEILLVMCPVCLTCWLPSPGAHTRASAWQAQCPRMSNLTQTWCMAVLSSAKATSGRGERGEWVSAEDHREQLAAGAPKGRRHEVGPSALCILPLPCMAHPGWKRTG